MNSEELLAKLVQAGAIVTNDGGKLRIDAPRGMLAPALVARLRWHKQSLLRLLPSLQNNRTTTVDETAVDKTPSEGTRKQGFVDKATGEARQSTLPAAHTSIRVDKTSVDETPTQGTKSRGFVDGIPKLTSDAAPTTNHPGSGVGKTLVDDTSANDPNTGGFVDSDVNPYLIGIECFVTRLTGLRSGSEFDEMVAAVMQHYADRQMRDGWSIDRCTREMALMAATKPQGLLQRLVDAYRCRDPPERWP